MKRLLLLLLAALASLAASSADAATCTTDYCVGQVSQVYTTASGSIYINMTGGMSGLNCTLVSSTYVTLDPTVTNAKYLYALLLSAEMTGRSVMLHFIDNSTGCTINYGYT